MTKVKVFSKIRTLFSIFKKGRRGLPSPLSCAPVSGVWLNMHQYSWMCANILENFWINCSDYAKSLKITDHLTGSAGFWRCQGLSRVPYASIMPEYAWICLNVSQYTWTWLNIADCPWIYLQNAWINCSDYARVLNIPRYSYNNIIIIVTLLEFLSAQFVHPGALLPFCIFWHNLEHKNNES